MDMNKKEFEADRSPPSSIREYVEDIVWSCALSPGSDKVLEPGQSIDDLLKQVYRHIEAQALRQFKSNELWAIRAWTYENILQDSVAKAAATADDALLDQLISPIAEWQKTEFDPLEDFRRRLLFSGRKDAYVRECLRPAAWFVGKYGKKQRYTQTEILEFLDYLDKRYTRDGTPGRQRSTYVTRLTEFRRFLTCLPEDEATGRKQGIPFSVPSYPLECHAPAFTSEEIEQLIYAAVMDEKPEIVLRLCVASIYGTRLGELANLSSHHIDLERDTIAIPTEKKGERKPQPLPEDLLTLFHIPLEPRKAESLLRDLKRICRKAKVHWPHHGGYHAIRRSVVSGLWNDTDLKEIAIRRFMRWNLGGQGGGGVMPRYVRTPIEQTDREVLSKHPFLPMWRRMIEFLPYLPRYNSYLRYYHIPPF